MWFCSKNKTESQLLVRSVYVPLSHSPRPAPIMTTITAASGQVDLNGKSHHGHLVPVNGGALLSPPNGANNTGANGAGETRGGGGATFRWKYCNSLENHLVTRECFRSKSQWVECQKEWSECSCERSHHQRDSRTWRDSRGRDWSRGRERCSWCPLHRPDIS